MTPKSKLSIHLLFSGHCESAFRFYEQSIGGDSLTMLTYGDSPTPEQVPLEWRDKIVHATLAVGDTVLAGADVLPEQYKRPQGFYVLLEIARPPEAERVFRALGEGGEVQMPLQKTFWSPAFGVLTDQFGVSWEINCGQEVETESNSYAEPLSE